MSNDIVQRLRDQPGVTQLRGARGLYLYPDVLGNKLCLEAADEIERLRAQLDQARNELSAALGWPGGISAELLPWHELLIIVERMRLGAAAQTEPKAAVWPSAYHIADKLHSLGWRSTLDEQHDHLSAWWDAFTREQRK